MTLHIVPRPVGASELSRTSVRDAITLFFRGYAGRDPYLAQRLSTWSDFRLDDGTLLGDKAIVDITSRDCEAVVSALTRRGATRRALKFIDGKPVAGAVLPTGRPLSTASINRYITSFMTLWKGCQSRQMRLVDRAHVCPAKGLTENEDEGARTRFLTREEFDRLRYCCSKSTWSRLEALVVLAVTTALRASSLRALRWRDVDLKRGTLTIGRTKNGKPQVAVLAPAARALLEKLPGPKELDHLVFRGKHADKPHECRKAWEAARHRAGLDDGQVCFHTLRHTAASWAAQAGHSPLEISNLTGHRSLVSLRRYTHLDTSNLQRMSERLFGTL
jgi:integrase